MAAHYATARVAGSRQGLTAGSRPGLASRARPPASRAVDSAAAATLQSSTIMADLPIIKKLEAEIEALDREFRITLPRLIREAAAQGDLSDNAEYRAAKQRQEFVNARITQLKQRLAGLAMINLASIPRDRAGFGSRVTLEDADTGEERVFRLVLPEEVDAPLGLISAGSPVGQALVGKQENDEVVIRTPAVTRTYLVIKLRTIHDPDE
jgi:transcription elongation factor GreA